MATTTHLPAAGSREPSSLSAELRSLGESHRRLGLADGLYWSVCLLKEEAQRFDLGSDPRRVLLDAAEKLLREARELMGAQS
jgi:hypothetical protein